MTTIFTMASLSLRFRTAIAIFSLLPFQILLAGHAIYNPIVFARDGEPIKAWETRPVSVGIPIPRAADFKEVENLLLVGSDWAQFRPLSYWPNGSIKWLQLDALIEIPNTDAYLTFILTTGENPLNVNSLAESTPSTIHIENRDYALRLPRAGSDLLTEVTFQGKKISCPLQLQQPSESGNSEPIKWDSIALLENGPIKAVIEFRDQTETEAVHTTTWVHLTAFRDYPIIAFETTRLVQTQTDAAELITVPSLQLSCGTLPENSHLGAESTFHFHVGQDLKTVPLALTANAAPSAISVLDGQSLGNTAVQTKQFLLDLRTEPKSETLPRPHLAKAASVDVYNDSNLFNRKRFAIREGDPVAEVNTAFENFLQTADASFVGYARAAETEALKLGQAGFSRLDLWDESLATWAYLMAKPGLQAAHSQWQNSFYSTLDSQGEPLSFTDSDLVHLANGLNTLNGPENWERLFTGLLASTASSSPKTASPGTSRMECLLRLANNGGFTERQQYQLLDKIEEELIQTNETDRLDAWYMTAFQLAGEPNLLNERQRMLANLGIEMTPNLRHLTLETDRYRIWKPLSLSATEGPDKTVILNWTSTSRMEAIRIKRSNSSISADFGNDDFCRAIAIEQELRGLESTTVPKISANESFAGRFLERGSALPRPIPSAHKTAIEKTSLSVDKPQRQHHLWFLGLGFTIIAALWFMKRKSLSQSSMLLLLAPYLILFLGCSKEISPAPMAPVALNEFVNPNIITDGQSFAVSVLEYPSPIPKNKHFNLTVQIREKAEAAEFTESIEIEADMPSHGHGMNTTPKISKLEDGLFKIEGMLLHMSGEWEIYVDVLGEGSMKERATFPVTIK